MKRIIFVTIIILSFLPVKVEAQFNANSFDFTGNAQALQLNPGADYQYKHLFGIPLLNNIQVFAGNTGFTMYDVFSTNGSFDSKVFKTVAKLKNSDYIQFNYRQDIFSYGYTDKDDNFRYFGLYWDMHHISYLPADFIRLGLEGNASHLFEKYDLSYLASKTEFVQTIYYGVNKKISQKLHFGYKLKVYSGIANAQSINNSGQLYTTEGNTNYYTHHFDDIDLSAHSSGYNENGNRNYYLRKLLFSGNYGPGIDVGFTYQYSDNLTLSASLLDLGFIYYTTDIKGHQVKGKYTYEGAKLIFPESGIIDYWKAIKSDFKEKLPSDENNDKYLSVMPTAFYASAKYGLGDLQKQKCENFLNLKQEHNSFLGITGFAQYQPVKIHLGISAFYEQKWSKHFYTKLNYTVDNFSYSSIGAGMSLNIGRLQLFLSADNLIGLSDLSQSNKQSIQFGLNIIGH